MCKHRQQMMGVWKCVGPQSVLRIGLNLLPIYVRACFAPATWVRSPADTFFCVAEQAIKSMLLGGRFCPKPSSACCWLILTFALAWPSECQATRLNVVKSSSRILVARF